MTCSHPAYDSSLRSTCLDFQRLPESNVTIPCFPLPHLQWRSGARVHDPRSRTEGAKDFRTYLGTYLLCGVLCPCGYTLFLPSTPELQGAVTNLGSPIRMNDMDVWAACIPANPHLPPIISCSCILTATPGDSVFALLHHLLP